MNENLINHLFAAADQPPANPPNNPFVEAPDFIFITAPRSDDNPFAGEAPDFDEKGEGKGGRK